MVQKEQKDFSTKDLWLASALSYLLNIEPGYRVEDGKTIFIFPQNDSLYKAIVAYNNGVPLNVYEYAQRVKRLRAEMHSRRGMERQR